MLVDSLPWVLAAALLATSTADEVSSSPPLPPPQQLQESAAATATRYPWPQHHSPLHQPEEGYSVQTGYEGYLVPTLAGPPSVDPYSSELLPLFGGVGVAWAAAAWLAGHAAALALGVLLALGACKLTPLCSGGWLGTPVEHLRSLAAPANLARAATTLKRALDKYGKRARKAE